MYRDPITNKRRSSRNHAATLPSRVPMQHVLIFCNPRGRDRARSVSRHWDKTEKQTRQQFYFPLVIQLCPVTAKKFSKTVDYRKRFIALTTKTFDDCGQKTRSLVVSEANRTLEKFNKNFSVIVIGSMVVQKRDNHYRPNVKKQMASLGDVVFKEEATLSFKHSVTKKSYGHYRRTKKPVEKPVAQLCMNVKMKPLTLPESFKNNNDTRHTLMIQIWIRDKQTNAIGLWGMHDGVLASWECWDEFDDTPVANYHAVNDDDGWGWGEEPLDVGSDWSGGHLGEGRYGNDNILNLFPWFSAIKRFTPDDPYFDTVIDLKVTKVKYKLVPPPAPYNVANYPQFADDQDPEMVDLSKYQDILTEFELEFGVYSWICSDSCHDVDDNFYPFLVDDMLQSMENVNWI